MIWNSNFYIHNVLLERSHVHCSCSVGCFCAISELSLSGAQSLKHNIFATWPFAVFLKVCSIFCCLAVAFQLELTSESPEGLGATLWELLLYTNYSAYQPQVPGLAWRVLWPNAGSGTQEVLSKYMSNESMSPCGPWREEKHLNFTQADKALCGLKVPGIQVVT